MSSNHSTWPGWRNCGNGLWERPNGSKCTEAPPPYPERPQRVAVLCADGVDYAFVSWALARSHRHKPMTLLLHTPPPPDSYCVANRLRGYVFVWAETMGVPVEPLPLDWPHRAAELADGVIDFGGRPVVPGVPVWRPEKPRRG